MVRQDVIVIVDRDVLVLMACMDVVLHELPAISSQDPMKRRVQTEPAVLGEPHLFQGEIMLTRLVMIINFWGDLEVLGDDCRTRDIPRNDVAMVISPSLHIGSAVLHGARTRSSHKEQHLLSVVLVADRYERDARGIGCEDQA